MLIGGRVVVAALGGLGAVSTGSAWAAGAAPQDPPATVAVSITDGAYAPDPVAAHVGDTVTWTNEDDLPHDVYGASGPAGFRSPMLSPGQSWSYTMTGAGTFVYVCTIHETMAGTVAVAEHVEDAPVAPVEPPVEPPADEAIADVPPAAVVEAVPTPTAAPAEAVTASAAPAVLAPTNATATAAEPARSFRLDLRLVGAALLTFALVAVALSLASPTPDPS